MKILDNLLLKQELPIKNSLDSLAKVALDDMRALDSILAEKGGVCAVAHTTWIDISEEGVTQLPKITN